MATYTIGPPKRPTIVHDNGFLDRFPLRDPTMEERAEFLKWIAKLEAGEEIQGIPFVPHNDIPDALSAYRHFLFGNGQDRLFSYERYVANDPNGAKTLVNAILDARRGAEALYVTHHLGSSPVHFEMTGSAIAVGSKDPLFPYPATENWQKALGAHILWISAEVNVKPVGSGRNYSMRMSLHAEDRYNFNPGAKDIATGIPDSENGVFEVTGLARQYMNYAVLIRQIEWQEATLSAKSVSRPYDVREAAPPPDTRRPAP
jgi:hypothetical protein